MRISDWSSDVCSSDLVVADDRQVDQKAEHAGAEEVPEAHRHQEIERPLIRHAFALTLLIAFRLCGTDEVPGVERQQGQRYDFQRRKQRGNGQRSEEHTSELQSLMRISYAVFCLKKKKKKKNKHK